MLFLFLRTSDPFTTDIPPPSGNFYQIEGGCCMLYIYLSYMYTLVIYIPPTVVCYENLDKRPSNVHQYHVSGHWFLDDYSSNSSHYNRRHSNKNLTSFSHIWLIFCVFRNEIQSGKSQHNLEKRSPPSECFAQNTVFFLKVIYRKILNYHDAKRIINLIIINNRNEIQSGKSQHNLEKRSPLRNALQKSSVVCLFINIQR